MDDPGLIADALWGGRPGPDVRCLRDPPASDIEDARRRGAHVQRYIVLGDGDRVRWLVPANRARHMALSQYVPYRLRGRIWKAWKRVSLLAPAALLARDTVAVISPRPSPVEQLLREAVGSTHVLSFGLGAPGPYRKIVAMVLHPSGGMLAFAKLGVGPSARDRLDRESRVLGVLAREARLHTCVPAVIGDTSCGSVRVLVLSPGPKRPGPAAYLQSHEEFLADLHAVRTMARPLGEIAADVTREWGRAANGVSALSDVAAQALQVVHAHADHHVACGIVHGDFAPWNTRLAMDRLYVFDWEHAAWDEPQMWDALHFWAQTQVLLAARTSPPPALARRAMESPGGPEAACAILYVLSTAARLADEQSPSLPAFIPFYRSLLERLGPISRVREARR